MKFKVGDRIKVYGSNTQSMTLIGAVTFIGDNYIRVRPDKNQASEFTYHPKQCRKIVKKKLRRIWIRIESNGCMVTSNKAFKDSTEFVETRRKK